MQTRNRVDIPHDQLAAICQRYHVRDLSLFGSVLRDDFRDDSDVDVLVEFEPEAPIGLLDYIALQEELAVLLQRNVDLVSKRGLKRVIRDRVLASSRVVYAT